MVVQEMQKGYVMHDRLLRPAMVVVSKAKDTPAPESGE
jgi:molecular chaperone GrpE